MSSVWYNCQMSERDTGEKPKPFDARLSKGIQNLIGSGAPIANFLTPTEDRVRRDHAMGEIVGMTARELLDDKGEHSDDILKTLAAQVTRYYRHWYPDENSYNFDQRIVRTMNGMTRSILLSVVKLATQPMQEGSPAAPENPSDKV